VKAVNLIPSDQRGGGGSVTGESDGGAFIVVGLLAGLAVLALLYGVARHQISSRTSEVASVTAQAQATQARASQLAPYVSFKATYQTRLQAVSQLVGTRFDWAHAIHEIGRVLPKDAALSSLHGTIGSATGSSSSSSSAPAAAGTVSSATPPGAVPVFSLAGCATTQSEVAETLQRLRLIDGVSTVTLQSSTKSSGSSGGGSGGCSGKDPAFAMQVSFAPLPTPSGASATPAASTTGAAATPTTSATPAAPTPATTSTPSGGA
jgi:type II secretory pathway pseudopilin PulG